MADKIKVPLINPDGSVSDEVGILMEVTESKEPWSEYTLTDGTKIRVKQTLMSIAKIEDKTAQNGEPIYAVQSQQIMSILPKV